MCFAVSLRAIPLKTNVANPQLVFEYSRYIQSTQPVRRETKTSFPKLITAVPR